METVPSVDAKTAVQAALSNLAVSEMRSIPQIVAWMLRVDDQELQRGFAMMLADESKHVRSLVEAVAEIGGRIEPQLAAIEKFPDERRLRPSLWNLAYFLGRVAHIEAELPSVMESVLAKIDDPEMAASIERRLRYIANDENRHRDWASQQLQRLIDNDSTGDAQDAFDAVDRSQIGESWDYTYPPEVEKGKGCGSTDC